VEWEAPLFTAMDAVGLLEAVGGVSKCTAVEIDGLGMSEQVIGMVRRIGAASAGVPIRKASSALLDFILSTSEGCVFKNSGLSESRKCS
jgi:hypothetical protein